MIISHEHKFIFIKTRKTSGTSLEIALSKIIQRNRNDVLTPLNEEYEAYRKNFAGIGHQNHHVPIKNYKKVNYFNLLFGKRKVYEDHMPASEIMSYVDPDIWNSYYKFCFEREPKDYTISLYSYMLSKKLIPQINIDEFIENWLHRYSNFDLYSKENRIIVDQVFKYEDLEESLRILSDSLGLSSVIDLKSIKANSSIRKNIPFETLKPSSQNKINKLFAREIAYFY